ncbi:MAG: MATE family efflux transporter [Eubacteriales bacterium]
MYNIYSVKNMIKPGQCLGEMPSTRETYISLIRIALPSVIEMVLSSLIGLMDTMMVGNLGSAAIASVGLTGQPRMLILSIFFALNIGMTAIIARRRGEERRDDANRTLRSMLAVIFGLSLALTVFAVLFAPQLMRFAGAIEGETLESSAVYFRIIMSAVPINAVTMAMTASLRGIGNTKVTMYVNTISNVVNIICNYLLIEGRFGFPRLEVAGAALASVIGMTVGFILTLVAMTRRESYLQLSLRGSWKPQAEFLRPVFKIGGNAVLEQIALRIGFFLFARIVADLGTQDFATHQICMQFLNITFTIGDGIGIAATSLVGQNMGRGRPDVSMLYGKAAQRAALTVSLLLIAVIISLRIPLVKLFNNDPYIVDLGSKVMIIVALFQPFQTTSVVISGCLRGSGDTRFIAVVMLICITLIRPTVCMINVYVLDLGLIGAWSAAMFDMVIRMSTVYIRFASFKWAQIKV